MNDELRIELRDETHAVPVGTTPYQLADREGFLKPDRADPILGASINNRLISLRHPLARNGRMKLLRYTHRYGHYFYRRGLTLVLNLAFSREFPDRDLIVGHSLENGYYYQIEGVNGLSRGQLSSLEEEMDSLIEEDLPFEVERHSFDEARELFASRNEPDKLRLLDHWNPDSLDLHRAGEILDVAYFPAPASSGRLTHFELRSHKPGFILRFPDPRNHKVIPEPTQQTGLFQIYQESQQWAKIINVGDVGALNRAIAENDISDVIKISEALHEKKISNIADTIHDRRDRLDVISIAGPTSSGKTTFSKRLMVQLRVNGLNPVKLSTDDYFVERERTPLDEEGNYDFETIEAIDLELFNDHLDRLMNGQSIEVPEFDFDTGTRETGHHTLQLDNDELLIIEGIHGLNPRLTRALPRHRKFYIYTSALTQLVIDNRNRISTSDSRLIRRIIRDMLFRNIMPETNINRWQSVRRGEEKYIFPYQEEADVMFNTALLYELAALKPYIVPALSRITEDQPEFTTADRLRGFMDLFKTINSREVPPTSILREFIGGSSFNY